MSVSSHPMKNLHSSYLDGGYLPPYHSDIRLFPNTKIGVFICSSGPGRIVNFPRLGDLAYSIFELVRGTNQSVEQILSDKLDVGQPFIEQQLIKGHKTNRASTALLHNRMRNPVELEDVLGVYGHPYDGDLTIRYEPESGNSTLQVFFSKWAYGRLELVQGSNTTFSIQWQTSIIDELYSNPGTVRSFWIDFGVTDSVQLREGNLELYNEFNFVRNATLDTFPSIPWTPASCGPEQKHGVYHRQ